ncbi:serine/threonine protein kinase [Candidatus Micrarchaeota archaeon]|nr:serine/threonine protein kinase [Candidatus Micrarchaeota archaeon]
MLMQIHQLEQHMPKPFGIPRFPELKLSLPPLLDEPTLIIDSRSNRAFRTTGLLGSGGTAKVYGVRGVNGFGREQALAIKIPVDAEYSRLLIAEKETLERLDHPTIPKAQALIRFRCRECLVMERVGGNSLRGMIGQLTAIEAVRTGRLVLGGMNYMQLRGYTHNDLKPDNILLVGATVKIIDFGIARRKNGPAPEYVEGTPHYMAPERFRLKAPNEKTEIYSFGVLLYEMLSGELPFNATSVSELATMHMQTIPARFDNERITPELVGIVLRMLAKDPEQRPTIEEVIFELDFYMIAHAISTNQQTQ